MIDLKRYIRNVPDFPKKGIMFRDITTLVGNPKAFREVMDYLTERYRDSGIDLVAAIESRGFIFGGALAQNLGCGFVPIRKPGKLPYQTISAEYELEYGTDTLELHTDAVSRGQRVLLLDDLLATGGTLKAAADLIEKLGGVVHEIVVLVELAFLNGRTKLDGYNFHSVVVYDSE